MKQLPMLAVTLVEVCQVNIPIIKIILSHAGPLRPVCVSTNLCQCQIRLRVIQRGARLS